jgi:hypothetical protein
MRFIDLKETTKTTNKKRKICLKRYSGKINIWDFIDALYQFKEFNPVISKTPIVADIRNSILNFSIKDIGILSEIVADEFSSFTNVNLIIIVNSPTQAAYSFFLKSKLEKSTLNVNVYSSLEAIKY